MQVIERFTLCERNPDAGTGVLALDGKPTSTSVDGIEIEAQYLCRQGRYLICVGTGTGWDDQFTLYLLDKEGTAIDAITGGGLMSSGVFRAIACGDDALDFACFSDQRLRLSIAPTPHWHALAPAPWRYRSLLSRHHLTLREIPSGAGHE